MATLRRDGMSLHYEEKGSGGPPLVLVHGLIADPTLWSRQVAHFGASHRVVTVTLRGFGDGFTGEPGAGVVSIDAFADDVAWTCVELGLHRPVLVGHSAGGLVALAIAARTRIAGGVVAIDTPIFLPDAALAQLAPLAGAFHSPAYRDAVLSFAASSLLPESDADLRRRVLAAVGAVPQSVVAPTWDSILAFDAAAALAACAVPAMHIRALFPSDQARMRAVSPHLVTEEIPGDHFPHVSRAGATNAAIDKILAAAAGDARAGR